MEGETPEERDEARTRGYRLRELLPSQRAQERYPLEKYPCDRCANPKEGLPHLVDNGSEFYWHHQHDPPGSSARSGCPRFGDSEHCGNRPRPGTATSLWVKKLGGPPNYSKLYPARTEEEYLAAFRAVEEDGADDDRVRNKIG